MKISEATHISQMNPSQFIGQAWRTVNGSRQLVEINYLDSDWPNGYAYHFNRLQETISSDGCATGAFDEAGRLIGFATVNREVFGHRFRYVLLDQLFISLESRRMGIGKTLFLLSADAAREWGADKLYICAGSAKETIDFYLALGCREAVEIDEDRYASDPRDMQMEYVISG